MEEMTGPPVSVSSDCNCVLESLIELEDFGIKNLRDIVKEGRPTPSLPNLCTKTKSYTRHFQESWYSTYTWLCGCKLKQKLYCWPCVLFSSEDTLWTKNGVSDMNNFINIKTRHENSKSHIKSLIALIKFGQNKIDFSLSDTFTISTEKYNEQVKSNRQILKDIIDVTCFLASQELTFRTHESEDSDNRGNYVELLHLLARKDDILSNHLETSSVFQGTSSDIQNEIINCIASVLTNEISNEMEKALFVAVIMDETKDISNKSLLSTVVRYVSESGEVCERLLTFGDVSNNLSAANVAEHLFLFIENFNLGKKIIAQTYDGAAVMAEQHGGIQKLIRDRFPCALFVHCYAHKLNLVLIQSVEHIRDCKICFQTIFGFATFFSKSIKRANAIDTLINRQFPPSMSHMRLFYDTRLIELVSSYKTELLELFSCMKDDVDEWDGETRACARGFHSVLLEFGFNFLLNLFSRILPKSAVLFNTLQSKLNDINHCLENIECFKTEVKILRLKFEEIWTETEACFSEEINSRKRQKTHENDLKTYYCNLFYEIIDTISIQLTVRFAELSQLNFLSLLDQTMYNKYTKQFPDSAINSLQETYGQFFEIPRLKSELTVLYSSEDFQNKPACELMQYLSASGLNEALRETTKLINLILTIPTTNAYAERSCSTLKRIKTCLRNSESQTRLSGLTLISIEKRLLKKMMQQVTFHDNVIDLFCEQNRMVDLKYR